MIRSHVHWHCYEQILDHLRQQENNSSFSKHGAPLRTTFHPCCCCRSGSTGACVWVTATFVPCPLSKPLCPGVARCGTRSFNGLVEWPSILFLCRVLSVDWANLNRVGDINVWVGGGVGGDMGACCISGGVRICGA